MIDSRLGVGILATVAVGASILAFAWRVPVPATMTGPIWPNLDANKIHRISVARPGKATIELQRDAGATLDDWHFADLPSVHPSLPSLHDFLAVAASTQWRSKVAAQPEAAMATISIDSAPLVAIGASLPGVGAARWHRGNEVLLVDDWIAAALLSDVDKLQIPGPWRIVDGSPLQVAITGDLTPAHSISFARAHRRRRSSSASRWRSWLRRSTRWPPMRNRQVPRICRRTPIRRTW